MIEAGRYKTQRCLGCYQPIETGYYHPKCSKALFGQLEPPLLEASASEVDEFAQKFLNRRLTVTGVQRKLSLDVQHDDKSRLTIVGSLGGRFIMKPPSPDYEQMPEIEDLCMHLAKVCGIKTALHGLVPMKDGALSYVTKRFDRKGKKKVAVEDLCQLSELLTEQKYRSSHERAGKVIRLYSSVPGDDVLRFFELIVFSFLIGNNDMHLKNFSLITDEPQAIRLSPAYDLLAVRLLLSAKEDPEQLALSTNGKKAKLKSSDFMKLAESLQIPQKVALRTISGFANAAENMQHWIDASFISSEKKVELKKLIETHLEVLTS